MSVKRKAVVLAGSLLAIGGAVAALPARGESSVVYQYSVSPQSEYCGGGCQTNTLCCRIQPQ